MNRLLYNLFALSVALFSACSDDERVVASFAGNGNSFSPSALTMTANIGENVDIVSAKVVRLNYDFNPVDTIPTAYDNGVFKTESEKFSSPYVKVLLEGRGASQKNKMEFAFFRDISVNTNFEFGFEEAAVEKHVETLLKEGKNVDGARTIAVESLQKSVGADWDSSWYYLLCQYQVSDSAFYENFKELRSLMSEGASDLDSMKVRAADELFKDYDEKLQKGYVEEHDFIEYVYGWMKCAHGNGIYAKGDSTEIKNPLSKFNGDILICDYKEWDRSTSVISSGFVWRHITETEKMLGKLCYYDSYNNGDSLIYGDDLYHCGGRGFASDYDWVWTKDTDEVYVARVLLDARVAKTYGVCGVDVSTNVLRYFNDTLFICTGYYKNYVGDIRYWEANSETIDGLYISKTLNNSNRQLDSATAFGDACMNRDVATCDSTINKKRENACGGYFECDGSYSRIGLWKPIRAVDFYHEKDCVKDSVGNILILTEDESNSVWECRSYSYCGGIGCSPREEYQWYSTEEE